MKIDYILYNNVCITLTATLLKNKLHFNCAYTLTTFQKQVSINKWTPLMSIWIWQWLSLMLTLMSLSSIVASYFQFSESYFTLTDANVNVDSFSIRAYISQCKGKQLLKLESLMLMSFQVLVWLSLMLTLMSIKSKLIFYV